MKEGAEWGGAGAYDTCVPQYFGREGKPGGVGQAPSAVGGERGAGVLVFVPCNVHMSLQHTHVLATYSTF